MRFPDAVGRSASRKRFAGPLLPPLGGSGTVPFDPATLFGAGDLGGAYDLTDLTKVFQDAGVTPGAVDSVIGRVVDLSGKGNHWDQSSGSLKPTLRSTGSYNYAEFDGLDDVLTGATLIPLSPSNTIISAFQIAPGTSNASNPFTALQVTSGNSHRATFKENGALVGTTTASATLGKLTSGVTAPGYAAAPLIAVSEFMPGTNSIQVNNDPAVTVANDWLDADTTPNAKVMTGNGNVFPLKRLIRVIVINRQLTAPEKLAARQWCAAGFGASAS